MISGFPGGTSGKEPRCQCRRHKRCRFNPWVWEDPLEKDMAIHSSIPAWRIPRTEAPDGLQSMGLHRVRNNRSNLAHTSTHKIIVQSRTFLLTQRISQSSPNQCTQRQPLFSFLSPWTNFVHFGNTLFFLTGFFWFLTQNIYTFHPDCCMYHNTSFLDLPFWRIIVTCTRFPKQVALKVHFIEVQLICSVVLASAVKQGNSVTHMHTCFFIVSF